MTSSTTCILGMAAILSVAATAGCGNHAETPQPPYPNGGYVYDAGPAFPPPPPPVVDAGAPMPTQATACDAISNQAVATMFMARQKLEAPGMNPEGAAACATVAEGQSASSQTVMLQPGHCYSVLAQGLPAVTELGVRLEIDTASLPPLLAMYAGKPVLAETSSTSNTAGLSVKNDCYQWPFPLPAAVKVTVRSNQGAGIVAAQLYSKKK